MPIEEKFEKFLPTILDVIYGIVIIAGFGVAIKISFPLTNLIPHMDVSYTFSNYNGLITAISSDFPVCVGYLQLDFTQEIAQGQSIPRLPRKCKICARHYYSLLLFILHHFFELRCYEIQWYSIYIL